MALSRTPEQWPFQGPLRTDGTSVEFDQANYGATVTGPANGAQKITPAGASGTKYLKWQEDHCTGMKLGATANKFYTGPFSGCCFFIAKDKDGGAIILHSNDNQHRGDSAATRKTQKKYADAFLAKFYSGATICNHVSYETMGGKIGWIEGELAPPSTWNIYYAITEENVGGYAARRLVAGAVIA